MQPEPGLSEQQVATDQEQEQAGDGFGVPPEMTPGFMPTIRRIVSRFLSPRKKRLARSRRARGWRALLARFKFQSKFMTPPGAPSAPSLKPSNTVPPKPPRPLGARFNRPAGPKM